LTVFFFRDKTGKFPDYPDDDEGGSAAIFKEKDPLEVILYFCNPVIPFIDHLTFYILLLPLVKINISEI